MIKRFLGALTEVSARHGVGMVIVATMLPGTIALAQTGPISSFTIPVSQETGWVRVKREVIPRRTLSSVLSVTKRV